MLSLPSGLPDPRASKEQLCLSGRLATVFSESEFLCHIMGVQGDLVMKKEFPPSAYKCSLTIHGGCRSGRACGESSRLVYRASL